MIIHSVSSLQVLGWHGPSSGAFGLTKGPGESSLQITQSHFPGHARVRVRQAISDAGAHWKKNGSHKTDEIYVAAAWGAKAHWLKNVKANPDVRFYLGSIRYKAKAKLVSSAEAVPVIEEYSAGHPRALKNLAAFMLEDPGETAAEQASRVAALVLLVRFVADAIGTGTRGLLSGYRSQWLAIEAVRAARQSHSCSAVPVPGPDLASQPVSEPPRRPFLHRGS